jgi:pyridine nucleotide-disulfide oxidoreductase family protein
VLITPGTHQTYSGMLPGWMAGHYQLTDCQIDLRPLAQAAGVKLVIGQLAGMDATQRRVELADGTHLDYDMLSLDVGGETDRSTLEALAARLLPIKPLATFVQRWPTILHAATQRDDYRLLVVGGGAAGVELALAAKHAIAKTGSRAEVALIASANGVLPGHARAVSQSVTNTLAQRGVVLHQVQAVGSEEGVLLSSGRYLPADIVIAATGSISPRWLQSSHLELDERGFVCVDATHRSSTHPEVFAAGDVCARTDITLARSGVHAVFAGPVLAKNLIAGMTGGQLTCYRPRPRTLYLLATGPKHAIASWGMFSASGRWVWRWKNWIDRRFMGRHKAGGSLRE